MTPLDYKPISGKQFPEWLNKLRNLSGAYVIRSKRSHDVLYVGESHTGNLAKTIKRHFHRWSDDPIRDHFTADRDDVEIAIRLTPPGSAAGA